MKVEIEIPDKAAEYFQLEAETLGVPLEKLLLSKLFSQNHTIVEKRGIPTAPTEEQVEKARAVMTVPCLYCKAPDAPHGVKHVCPEGG